MRIWTQGREFLTAWKTSKRSNIPPLHQGFFLYVFLWNIVDILAFGAFVLRFISLSSRWRCYSFACDDILDSLDAFFLSVNQCILTSNSTWKHFGDYSGTCGECTWLHLLTIDLN